MTYENTIKLHYHINQFQIMVDYQRKDTSDLAISSSVGVVNSDGSNGDDGSDGSNGDIVTWCGTVSVHYSSSSNMVHIECQVSDQETPFFDAAVRKMLIELKRAGVL